MKKSVILAVAIAALAVSSAASAQGRCVYPSDVAVDGSRCGARASSVRAGGYNPPQQGYNNSAAWNSAAIGAAGMVTGAIISGIMQNNANAAAQGYAQPGYAQPGYGYAPPAYGPPPGVVPVYPAPPAYGGYYQPRACVTQNVPQYDAYGRVVQFIRMCAN